MKNRIYVAWWRRCASAVQRDIAGEERERFHFRTVSFPNDHITQLLGINDGGK